VTTLTQSVGGLTPDDMAVSVAVGHQNGWRILRKFGMDDGVASGTQEMWPVGTPRVLPTAAAVVSILSDDPADDEVAVGTGAWTVTIEGLDANYDERTDAVTTTASFFRINRMYCVTAGTGEINAGNISASIGGDLQAYIEADEGQTHQTHYTVPAGHSFVVNASIVGVGRMGGSTDLHVLSQIKLAGADTAWRTISDIYLWDGSSHSNFGSVVLVPEKTEVRQQIVSTTTTQCYSIFSGYLVKNSVIT
jgi:hypothetical protein